MMNLHFNNFSLKMMLSDIVSKKPQIEIYNSTDNTLPYVMEILGDKLYYKSNEERQEDFNTIQKFIAGEFKDAQYFLKTEIGEKFVSVELKIFTEIGEAERYRMLNPNAKKINAKQYILLRNFILSEKEL